MRFLVWDLPVRLFHWLLVAGLFGAVIIVYGFGDHSPQFPYHALFGLTIVLMVVLRIIWGIAGTRYAKFSSFLYGPGKVIGYLKDVFTNGSTSFVGHNPGSSWAIYIMLICILMLGITGFRMGQGFEEVKKFHEFFATALMITVSAHILGIIVHTIRKKENITAGMIHGKKAVEEKDSIPSAKPIIAILFVLITLAWGYGVFSNYNAATGVAKLPVIGTSLQIGEDEKEEKKSDKEEREEHEEKD